MTVENKEYRRCYNCIFQGDGDTSHYASLSSSLCTITMFKGILRMFYKVPQLIFKTMNVLIGNMAKLIKLLKAY